MVACSSSESTITAVPVNIGNANVKKYVNHDYKHLVGKDYPLYGIKTRVPKNKNPKFNRMSQLAALVALEIVNEGDGKANGEANIEIRNVSYEVKNENIVGGFKVDITGDEPSFANGTSPANKTTVTIVDDNDKDSFISIAPGDSAKIYFAVKPHDASGKSVTITVNGSSRTITMPANTKFKMGQATTIRVPVKLSYPKKSNAIDPESSAPKFVTMSNVAEATLDVNGESVKAYIIGNNQTKGSITIEGTVRDLINAMDAGFYASSWEGAPAAMAIENINMSMPEYNSDGSFKKHTQLSLYNPLINGIGDVVYKLCGGGLGGIIAWGLWETVGRVAFYAMLNDGLYRTGSSPIVLTTFIAESTLVFDGIISNGSPASSSDIIIIDENPIYKEVGSSAVDKLFGEKFDDYTDEESGEIIIPTFQGLYDIVNGKDSDAAALTAQSIYGTLEDKIGTEGADFGIGIDIPVWTIFQSIFKSADHMKSILGDVLVKVEIVTHPVSGSQTYNPIVFWGINITE